MKKIILLIILLNSISFNSFAKESYKPSFEFELRGFLPPDRCLNPPVPNNEIPIPNCFSVEGLNTSRDLNETKKSIISGFDYDTKAYKNIRAKIVEENIRQYTLLRYIADTDGIAYFENSININYIIKDNINVGYFFLFSVDVTNFDSPTYVDKSIQQMKKFKRSNFLGGNPKIGNLKFEFYENKVGDFIELYAFVRDGNKEYFYLDSFFPEELKEHFRNVFERCVRNNFNIPKTNGNDKDETKDKDSGSHDDDKKIGK